MLDYTQSLYEKKLVTYPRTDSRFLTEDMAAGLPDLVVFVAGALPFAAKGKIVLSDGWKAAERAFRVSLKDKLEDEKEAIALPELAEGQTLEAGVL